MWNLLSEIGCPQKLSLWEITAEHWYNILGCLDTYCGWWCDLCWRVGHPCAWCWKGNGVAPVWGVQCCCLLLSLHSSLIEWWLGKISTPFSLFENMFHPQRWLYAIHTSTKIYKAEIILLFSFLAYFLTHICGLNITLNDVVAHRSQPGKSPCAVNGTEKSVSAPKRWLWEIHVPRGRGSKRDRGAGPNAGAAKQLSFKQQWWEGITRSSCGAVCSGWGANLTAQDPPVTIGWSGLPGAMADPSPCPFTYCAFLTGCCGRWEAVDVPSLEVFKARLSNLV